MAVQEGPDTLHEKALKRKWPVAEGLTAGTTRQVGIRRLQPTEASLIDDRNVKGS